MGTHEADGKYKLFPYHILVLDDERQIHALTMFHTYVMVLDVFSDFLVTEQRAVPLEWHLELRQVGQKIERRVEELKAALLADSDPAT